MNVKPSVAKSWDISSDALIYTFNLRNDVFFQTMSCLKWKGRKVIATDFEYSFNRLLDKDFAAPGAWVLGNVAFFLCFK